MLLKCRLSWVLGIACWATEECLVWSERSSTLLARTFCGCYVVHSFFSEPSSENAVDCDGQAVFFCSRACLVFPILQESFVLKHVMSLDATGGSATFVGKKVVKIAARTWHKRWI